MDIEGWIRFIPAPSLPHKQLFLCVHFKPLLFPMTVVKMRTLTSEYNLINSILLIGCLSNYLFNLIDEISLNPEDL